MIEPSRATITSFGLFSSLSPQCVASVSRAPSGRSRTTELVTCSQTIRFPSLSRVIPLHLLLGSRSTVTPSSGCQRRRLSPGMSLKWSDPSAIQIGPSVKVKPVAICSTSASSSTSRRSSSECTETVMTNPPSDLRKKSAPNLTGPRLVVDLEEVGHLLEPALLNEADVIRVLVVRRVGRAVSELHRDPETVCVLRARLPEDLERLDAGDLLEPCRRGEKVRLRLRPRRMPRREDGGMADPGCLGRRQLRPLRRCTRRKS